MKPVFNGKCGPNENNDYSSPDEEDENKKQQRRYCQPPLQAKKHRIFIGQDTLIRHGRFEPIPLG